MKETALAPFYLAHPVRNRATRDCSAINDLDGVPYALHTRVSCISAAFLTVADAASMTT